MAGTQRHARLAGEARLTPLDAQVGTDAHQGLGETREGFFDVRGKRHVLGKVAGAFPGL
ncbi:hypothetical protein MFU01_23940 [Myxococcus fulvus]|uniref:Uncharacterized protein n=1 Tax=Myxococcus fulvus TaxID=33 RepID=A0A511T0H6_MYXFU|nr:hypothetical protein MFU01_23940 [Myxococcus fulvus]